jgi:hypothetical protein
VGSREGRRGGSEENPEENVGTGDEEAGRWRRGGAGKDEDLGGSAAEQENLELREGVFHDQGDNVKKEYY